ncbi:hypothetical protein TNIN_203491 [Trichonephila inaurata madagascariensis]|uniref:Uncharacterized protein n=1 Tax=Trichonephila inaurata madagascariensis TaxID=2747483 RepID=A0A8X6WV21_9ARAC|nr:hypothetical protein TNIN_203491 [Trichonephila inaurata madagascariensis]
MVVISVKSEEAMTAVPSSTSSLPYDGELSDSDLDESNYHFQSNEGSFQAVACSSSSLAMHPALINESRGISFRNILYHRQITSVVPEFKKRLRNSKYYLCVLSSLLMVPILAIVLSKVQEPKKLTIVLFTLLIIFFIAEMASFYGMSTFDNASKGVFTHEICAYIHGMNMVASVVLFLICCSLFLDF